MTVNPLVVGRLDQPSDPWAGVWIVEDIELIEQGITNGSWIDATLGAVGAGLDGLALVSDPIGVLLQYGVAWIIEHVKPLTQALDWLAGDPAQIAGHAQTWRNVAEQLGESAAAAERAVRWDTSEWDGAAGSAYRDWATQQRTALAGLAGAARTMAAVTEGAGVLVGTVRALVRDAIATCVSRLVTYAAEEAFSLGLATPLVVEQVTTLIASWAARIARWLKALLASLRRLVPIVRRLGDLVAELKKILGRLRERLHPGGAPADGLTHPSRTPDPAGTPWGDPTPAHPTRVKDRAHRRENESADVLARHGYDVEQNPPGKPNGKNPDYKIEGEYFDCYSPDTAEVNQVRKMVSRKVKDGQADRIVLNLDDYPQSIDSFAALLRRKPIEGLKEMIIVKDGRVMQFYPFAS